MNNAYCVCTTPKEYYSYIKNWENFKDTGFDLKFISDNTSDPTFDVGFTYNEETIRKNLNFTLEPSKMNFWNSQGNRNIIWFYAHLRMLNFYISNPDYDYYYFFDDDIKMDDWVSFFDGMNNIKDIDFMSYFVFKSKFVESQPLVPKIDSKTYSGSGWFHRFPGSGDILPNGIDEQFGSFFPIVKYSNKAMKTLLEVNSLGFSGYHEGFVPTILNDMGMSMSTIIEPNNTSRYFDVNKINIKHKNIKIEWEWI